MDNVTRARHEFAACPCGHSEHVGRASLGRDGVPILAHGWPMAVCLVCSEVERERGVVLAIEYADRVATLGLAAAVQVRCDDRLYTVASAEPITKLGGAIATPFVRLALRPLAEKRVT